MKKLGIMLAMLSLIATAPSHADVKGANRQKINRTDERAWFKEPSQLITFVNNEYTGGDSDGSFQFPYLDIQTAIANSGDGCVIYIMSTEQPYKVNADIAPITLKKGQSLVGSCASIAVNGKKAPPLTPGKLPTIRIYSALRTFSPGIVVRDHNEVTGLLITGVVGSEIGIISDPTFSGIGVAGECFIHQNQFRHLETCVWLNIEAETTLEITENDFSHVLAGIYLPSHGEGIEARVCNNSFQAIPFGLVFGPPPSEARHLTKSILETHPRKNRAGQTKWASSSSTLSVEKNSFEKVSLNSIRLIGTQKGTVKGNSFQGGEYSLLDVLLSDGGQAHLSENLFAGCVGDGLNLSLSNGATACLEKNKFLKNEYSGLLAIGSNTGKPSCVELTDNFAQGNGTYGFLLRDLEAALERNKGTIELESVTRVSECPGCTQ